MHAAVYRGQSIVDVEEIPTPTIGPGEILIRVEACGICHTDLKKIEHNLLTPPRVYGHETAGVVGAVGRLDPIKNHEGLLRVVRSLQISGHKVRLAMAGDGPERSKIESLLRSPFDPKPLLLGMCSNTEHVYRCFDLFVLNSLAEGMSNTLLEAMASGLPAVCTAVGGNVELLAGRERGILVGAKDEAALTEAIRGYMTSPEMGRTHGSNARRFITQHFSLEQMIQRYAGLYESVA